jgi:hypothetical protein
MGISDALLHRQATTKLDYTLEVELHSLQYIRHALTRR